MWTRRALGAGETVDSNFRFYFDTFSALLLFLTAILGAWLPKYLCSHGTHVSHDHSMIFHLGNMLSAGVMLSAGFCHLLADAHRYLLFIGRFPITNFLAATGYIITLLADQVVQSLTEEPRAPAAGGGGSSSHHSHSSDAHPSNGHAHPSGYKKLPASAELTSVASPSCCPPAKGGAASEGLGSGALVRRDTAHVAAAAAENGATLHDPEHALPTSSSGARALVYGDDGSKLPLLAVPPPSAPRGGGGGGGGAGDSPRALARSLSTSGGGASERRADDCHAGGVAVLLGRGRKLSFATAVLLAAALCIHSILEGMALGAQQSMRSTEDIMVAIAAHKGLAAYALGASIVESGASSERFWTVIACFSLATPIGIFAGYGLSSGAASSKSGAALSALASGTFLYVAFMEVIPKELADGRHRALKMGAFLLGYGLMSLLAVWA